MSASAVVAALTRRTGLGVGRTLSLATKVERVGVGLHEVDAAFEGGAMPLSGCHEISAAAAPGDGAAASLFALGLACRLLSRRPGKRALLVQEALVGNEGGLLYGPGLQALGLDPDRWLFVTARDAAGVLRVVDEACKSGAPAAVVAEFASAATIDLKTTRRFNLSGERTGVASLLLTPRPAGTSAALTRWRAAAAPARGPAEGLLGPPTLNLELTRNRHGRLGAWTVEWNLDDRLFQLATPAVAVVRPPVDRSFSLGRDQFADDAHGRLRQVG